MNIKAGQIITSALTLVLTLALAFVAPFSAYAGVANVSSTVEINSSTTNGPSLANGDKFGNSVANIGDLNGDGVNDLAVGAWLDLDGSPPRSGSRGVIHIMFMNTDGSVDSTVEINSSTTNGPVVANGDLFGSSVANIGDLDGDGVQDLAVGAIGDDNGGYSRGAVHIMFMNTDGSVDSTVEINDTTTNGPSLADNDSFGSSVANIGDLDGDGVQDLAVGAHYDAGSGSYRGAVHIMFMNTDGSVDSTVEINDTTTNGPVLANGDYFGISAANIGDLDGDGVNDLAVGAYADDEGGDGSGTVHIMFMNTDGSVDSTVEINSSTTNGPSLADSDNYGASVANIGDLDGDGVQDLAVGAIGDDNGGSARGALHILYLVREATLEISSTNSAIESDGNDLPVLLVNGTVVSASTITVTDLGTGTATSGTDYSFTTPATVNIPAGTYDGTTATAVSLSALLITSDRDGEQDETIKFSIASPTGDVVLGDANGDSTTNTTNTYTILNDDPMILSSGSTGASIAKRLLDKKKREDNTTNTEDSSKEVQETNYYTPCPLYLNETISIDGNNNPEEVKKLEGFLNDHEGESLPVDGIYSVEDMEAVKRFQAKYKRTILDIWGISEPTGFVGKTTILKISSFFCNQKLACPAFKEFNSQKEGENNPSLEVQGTKALLHDLGLYDGAIDQLVDTSFSLGMINFQETFRDSILTPWGITQGTGRKYKTTNKFLNFLIDCDTPPVDLDGGGVWDL